MSDSVSGLLETLRAALAPDYQVERVLGTGGMGAVFLARDRTLDRLVAVKVVTPDLASSAPLRQRFLREARTIARLRHPSIVDVYSAGEADGLLYFIMRYVPGESLRDYFDREKRVPPGRAAVILRDLADALAYAHAQGVVRRAIAIYESINRTHLSLRFGPDPRWPLYARSFLSRGQLYEQLGDRQRAIAAYEQFLEIWKEASPELQGQVRLAREGLIRLRDAPAASVP
jgi:serine/threonine protein kinase